MVSTPQRQAGNPTHTPIRQGTTDGRTGRGFGSTDPERQRQGKSGGRKTANETSGEANGDSVTGPTESPPIRRR